MTQSVLSVREAAMYARVNEPLVRAACHSGVLPAAVVGNGERRKHYRIRREDLDAWISANYPTRAA